MIHLYTQNNAETKNFVGIKVVFNLNLDTMAIFRARKFKFK